MANACKVFDIVPLSNRNWNYGRVASARFLHERTVTISQQLKMYSVRINLRV